MISVRLSKELEDKIDLLSKQEPGFSRSFLLFSLGDHIFKVDLIDCFAFSEKRFNFPLPGRSFPAKQPAVIFWAFHNLHLADFLASFQSVVRSSPVTPNTLLIFIQHTVA